MAEQNISQTDKCNAAAASECKAAGPLRLLPRCTAKSMELAAFGDWYRQARAGNANLLLNAGPDTRGLMPEYHRRFLAAAANELGLKEPEP